MGKGAKTNRYLLSDDQRTKEDKLLKHSGLYNSIPEPVMDRPLRNRIEQAITRENDPTEEMLEERSEEMEYEDSENARDPQEPESIIDRMSWTTNSEETIGR